MMGQNGGNQNRLFYSFNLDDHVPANHLLRGINQFFDLADLRAYLAPFYSHTGRPSIDPELMIRMLIVGYCFGIRSERRLCEEVHLNLAYRWFCRLGIEDAVPEHSTFSENRHGRFRESDTFRHVFETVLKRCMSEGLVGGEGFAIDASVVKARALPVDRRSLHTRRTTWVDVRLGVIVDVEATSAHRTKEVDATRTMIDRVEKRFAIKPTRLIGEMAYGAAELLGWMVNDKAIEPHVPLWDRTQRKDDTLSSSDFRWDERRNEYRCPKAGRYALTGAHLGTRAAALRKPIRFSTSPGNPIARVAQ
jgi:transposase